MKSPDCKNPRCIDGIVHCNQCAGHCADFCEECHPDEPCDIELELGGAVEGRLDFEEENTECSCGKLMKDFENCPICNEKLCIDCEDWEKHHKKNIDRIMND